MCFIHASILLQGVSCDFFGIGPVGLGSAQGIIAELPNENGVYGADKDTCIRKPCGDRFIVPSGVFHADLGFPVRFFDLPDQVTDGGLGVGDVAGRQDDYITGPADGDSAFAFGNIDTNSVHKR